MFGGLVMHTELRYKVFVINDEGEVLDKIDDFNICQLDEFLQLVPAFCFHIYPYEVCNEK